MNDWMASFSGWYSSGSTPARLLRKQKKAIKLAGQKLQEIDKKYSSKILKADIQAENLLNEISEIKIIWGTTVWSIIVNWDSKVILVQTKDEIWGLPKGGIGNNETEEECMRRVTQEETGLKKEDLKLIQRLGQYVGYSTNHNIHKNYIWYLVLDPNPSSALMSEDNKIIKVEKFDTETVLDIMKSEHQKIFLGQNKAIIDSLISSE